MQLLRENGNLVTPNSKIIITWNEFPEKMTEAAAKQIKAEISQKYGVPIENITVKRSPINFKKNNTNISSLGQQIKEEIFDETNLKSLYVDFINKNNIKVDMDEFLKLDRLITSQLEQSSHDRNRFHIKKIWGKNMLSYGVFEKDFLNGIELLQSVPQNGGGKTNFINIVQFAFFGEYKYLSNRTKLSHVFNDNTPDTQANVFTEIEINERPYLIGRVLTKKKTVSQDLFFFKVTSEDKADVFFDTTRNILIDASQYNPSKTGYFGINLTKGKPALTQKTIEGYIGSLDDFFFSALITNENLMKWLETKPTERVLLFYEYFGLSTLNNKFDVAKTEYNKFKKQSMLERVVVKDVEFAISEKERDIKNMSSKKTVLEGLIDEEEIKLSNIDNKIKEKASKLYSLPNEFQNYDLLSKEDDLLSLTKKRNGINITNTDTSALPQLKLDIGEIDKKIIAVTFPKSILDEISVLEKDKDGYVPPPTLTNKLNILEKERDVKRLEYRDISTEIKTLTEELSSIGESIKCEHCDKVIFDVESKKQTLSTKIKGLELKLQPLMDEGKTINTDIAAIEGQISDHRKGVLATISTSISNLKQKGEDVVAFEKNKLLRDKKEINHKIEVIENHLRALGEHQTLSLKVEAIEKEIMQYKASLSQIEDNKKVRNEIISLESEKAKVSANIKNLNLEISEVIGAIRVAENFIKEKEILILELEDDIKKDFLYNSYMTVHDKFNGISKFIIIKYLPTINEELRLLLSGLVDFEVVLEFEDKSIEFFFKADGEKRELFRVSGYQKTMASLALHYVLMKLTTINIPRFCFIDEIYGSVGLTNIDYAQTLILKLIDIYDTVFFITHSKEFMEISNNFMLVGKNKDGYSVIANKKNMKEDYLYFMEEVKLIADINERSLLEKTFIDNLTK